MLERDSFNQQAVEKPLLLFLTIVQLSDAVQLAWQKQKVEKSDCFCALSVRSPLAQQREDEQEEQRDSALSEWSFAYSFLLQRPKIDFY
ncbi:MAG: hypothetical protein ABH956_01530 [Candidatus Nealsonbacteria bacterium]